MLAKMAREGPRQGAHDTKKKKILKGKQGKTKQWEYMYGIHTREFHM